MNESHLLAEIQRNPFLLAPMAGITDCAFRSFMREMGCGVVVTELVSATGLKFASSKTRKLMEFNTDQHPVGIQLFGEELDHLAYAAQVVEQMGADFVDLNFGCPVPKVVKKGGGSAILRDLGRMRDVLRAVKSAVKIPVTIKVRTGWDEQSRNTQDVVKIAADEGITWIAIHGRTRAAGYSGQADWNYIQEVKATSPIPIIGNGDLVCPQLAVHRLSKSGCDAVMIGRGCLKNPWIFQEARILWQGEASERGRDRDFLILFERLYRHLETVADERILILQLKKFSSWYSAGYPGSSQFRKIIFQTQDLDELRARIKDFFVPLEFVSQADTSNEPFLMGGHG